MLSTLQTVDYSNKFEVYFSRPKSWVMWAILDLHDYIAYFLINVLVVVLVFAAYCLLLQQSSFNFIKKNYEEEDQKITSDPENNKKFIKEYHKFRLEDFCHAPRVEFFWTTVPLIMLAFMGWPSFKTLYAVEQLVDPMHSVVVIGNQWYWSYAYSDFDIVSNFILELDTKENMDTLKKYTIKKFSGDDVALGIELLRAFKDKELFQLISKYFRDYDESKIMYDCVIISEEDLPKGYPRLLSTDQVLILPSHTIVRLMITSNDVIHSWALPSHGIKMDAVPGRINQVNFITSFWGTYWGQCSELCGINHGFMPIEVRVLPLNDYFDYIRLNTSYKVDKFVPLLDLLTELYLRYLNQKIMEEHYCFWYDDLYNNKQLMEDLEKLDEKRSSKPRKFFYWRRNKYYQDWAESIEFMRKLRNARTSTHETHEKNFNGADMLSWLKAMHARYRENPAEVEAARKDVFKAAWYSFVENMGKEKSNEENSSEFNETELHHQLLEEKQESEEKSNEENSSEFNETELHHQLLEEKQESEEKSNEENSSEFNETELHHQLLEEKQESEESKEKQEKQERREKLKGKFSYHDMSPETKRKLLEIFKQRLAEKNSLPKEEGEDKNKDNKQ